MAEARLCPQCGEEPSADAPAGLAPMQIGGRLPETQSFSRTHRKSTDKCRSEGHRKLIRFSARCSAHRIAIRFGGIWPRAARAARVEKMLGTRGQKSNVFGEDLVWD
jgi:hypothetical protein